MKQIFKYPLSIKATESARDDLLSHDTVVFKVSMPKWAKILTIQMQRDTPCIWALVDQESPAKEDRTIEVYGTGWDVTYPQGLSYIGTFQVGTGLVFHAFERTAKG